MIAGLSLVACGSSDESIGIYDVEGWATLRTQGGGTISYMSGFDGTNDYQVPFAFVGALTEEDVFSVGDETVASVVTTLPVNSSQIPPGITVTAVLIKSNGVGSTTIEGTVRGTTYTANLTVNGYTPEDVILGTERYNNPANANADLRRSCASCHDALQAHSTAFLADLTDAEILRTAVEGVGISIRDPETGEVREYMPNGGVHMWDVTSEERVGIAAYLRSRSPLYQLPTE